MQLCSLLEKLEDVCRSTNAQYSDDEFFQLAHDVLFCEVHLSAATLIYRYSNTIVFKFCRQLYYGCTCPDKEKSCHSS